MTVRLSSPQNASVEEPLLEPAWLASTRDEEDQAAKVLAMQQQQQQ